MCRSHQRKTKTAAAAAAAAAGGSPSVPPTSTVSQVRLDRFATKHEVKRAAGSESVSLLRAQVLHTPCCPPVVLSTACTLYLFTLYLFNRYPRRTFLSSGRFQHHGFCLVSCPFFLINRQNTIVVFLSFSGRFAILILQRGIQLLRPICTKNKK